MLKDLFGDLFCYHTLVNRTKISAVLDKFFAGGIVLKGLDGLAELVGGFILLFLPPTAVQHFITFLTHKELSEDPHDLIANFLIHAGQAFGAGSKAFAVGYLWIHAAIKLIAVWGILKQQQWAYPFSLTTLGILTLYQLYTLHIKLSAGMLILTIFDIVIILLIWREWRIVRSISTLQ